MISPLAIQKLGEMIEQEEFNLPEEILADLWTIYEQSYDLLSKKD